MTVLEQIANNWSRMWKSILIFISIVIVLTLLTAYVFNAEAQESAMTCSGKVLGVVSGDWVTVTTFGGQNPTTVIGQVSKEYPEFYFTYEPTQHVTATINGSPAIVLPFLCGDTYTCAITGAVLPDELIIVLENGASTFRINGGLHVEGLTVESGDTLNAYSITHKYPLTLEYFAGGNGYLPECQVFVAG